MRRDEATFFKHCLKDYNYFVKTVDQLKSELDYILDEKHHISLKTKSLIKVEKKKEYDSVYSSDEYYNLLRREEQCKYLINLYSMLIENTNRLINTLDEHTRSVLMDIYVSRVRPSRVADKYYYSDDKSMYRMIRNNLKKHNE